MSVGFKNLILLACLKSLRGITSPTRALQRCLHFVLNLASTRFHFAFSRRWWKRACTSWSVDHWESAKPLFPTRKFLSGIYYLGLFLLDILYKVKYSLSFPDKCMHISYKLLTLSIWSGLNFINDCYPPPHVRSIQLEQGLKYLFHLWWVALKIFAIVYAHYLML